MYFPPFEYSDKDVYIGSLRNPKTKRPIDIWLINGESITYKHGNEPHEYGSMQVKCRGVLYNEDAATWEFTQATIAVLYYMATGKTPLVPNLDDEFLYDKELLNYPTPNPHYNKYKTFIMTLNPSFFLTD